MSALVLRADAAHLPLPDESVDLVCTSPPYFALRAYQDGGETYAGQIGSEATPAEFLEALWTCTREWIRVLKPTGSIWVNLGDKYNAYNGGRGEGTIQRNDVRPAAPRGNGLDVKGIRAKSLLGLPWRYAIGCIDQLGLILRAEVVWSKPNGLPESVTDRVRRSHENWFHFTRQPRYFAAVDEIREPHTGGAHRGRSDGGPPPGGKLDRAIANGDPPPGGKLDRAIANGDRGGNFGATNPAMFNPLGKLPGSVWEIPSEPLTVPDHLGVDHFAAFPTEWPRRIIQGWSPSGICTACGEGRRPVVDATFDKQGRTTNGPQSLARRHESPGREVRALRQTTVTGYACACPTSDAPTRPAVILDPFGGTGTTALCASALGRIGISVDLSYDYSRLAQWRTTDPAQRAKAMRVDKPPVQLDGQADLFGGAA
jgi:DNA modification methylase